jgi:branched-chain amino acid transport system substrate-binding protein
MLRCLFWLSVAAIAATSGPAEAEIRIGFANPLSGPYATSGERNRIAAEQAVEDLNRQGGVLGQAVRLITADDACGLQRAVAAARELVAAGVVAVVGHMCSHSSLLAAGIYEAADILMISPDSTHPRLTEEGRRNVFRLIGRDDAQGKLAGNFLADHWSGGKIAILHDGSTYGEGLAQQARKQLHARRVRETIYDVYSHGAMDYLSLVMRLEQAGIKVLYIGGYGPDAGLILRTVRERGDRRLQLIGGDGVGMDEFWTVAGPAGEGTIFSARPNVRVRPDMAAVLEEFRARGLRARSGGLGAYAAVQVWAQAVERAGTSDLARVAEALRRGRFESVLGRVAFDDNGDLSGAGWQWQMWTNGTSIPLDLSQATQ